MVTLEEELKNLREKNNELVQKVQYWKMTAAERQQQNLNLIKENNELRLKLSRLRSNGSVQASNLDAALQSASEKALAHLVRASGEIARTMDLAKAYMRDRQELDAASPCWSSIGSTPTSVKKDKVHRVPPLMMGGQSIQPVVALTMLNTSNPRSTMRSPNPNINVTERAVPMHMLQDVYIPLTRIDAGEVQAQNMESEADANNSSTSTEDLGLNDTEEREMDVSQQMSEDEGFDMMQQLDVVTEDMEPEDEEVTPPRSRLDNPLDPLEGPSWMLDISSDNQENTSKARTTLEPDSTTELDEVTHNAPPVTVDKINKNTLRPFSPSAHVACEFSPTVRRRKRPSSSPPPAVTPRRPSQFSPRPVASRRISNSGRVLKVLVAKMRLEGEGGGAGDGGASSLKRAATFDAPSPNGATVAGVIVSRTDSDSQEGESDGRRVREQAVERRAHAPKQEGSSTAMEDISSEDFRPASRAERDSRSNSRCESRATNRFDSRDNSRANSRRDSRDSDSGSGGDTSDNGRTRRTRKVVTYKEKPLNRKLRR